MLEKIVVMEERQGAQIKIKGSKFIASAAPAWTEEKACSFIEDCKREFYDATHNVFAYRIQSGGSILERYNDDGEPSGSSGPPTLGAIKSLDLINTVVVVTRYFGGTKLGVGGLMRAYKQSAMEALNKAKLRSLTLYHAVSYQVSYDTIGRATGLFASLGMDIQDMTYSNSGVCIVLYLLPQERPSLEEQLRDAVRGDLEIEVQKKMYLPS